MSHELELFTDAAGALETIDRENPSGEPPERIGHPGILRSIHSVFRQNDSTGSGNRAKVQELKDFVPPIDPAELASMGMQERYNVNWGLVTAIINEAVGAYLDIITSPTSLSKIKLMPEVDEDMRDLWAGVMDDEFTRMMRSWDQWMPNSLQLADIFVTHGVSFNWFEDPETLFFDVAGMEDFKFDNDAEATPSKIEMLTVQRSLKPSDLYEKIEAAEEGAEYVDGWNVKEAQRLIGNARPKGMNEDDEWNWEAAQRRIKSNRFGVGDELASIEVVWGFVKELDGRISVYGCALNREDDRSRLTEEFHETPRAATGDGSYEKGEDCGEWLYHERFAYEDATQAFNVFAFSIGNKNRMHTVRGLGYALYEAGNADNVTRNKMLDAARARATDTYQSDGGVTSAEDLQFTDIGYGLIVPQGLKQLQNGMGQPLDKSIGVAMQSIQDILNRHSGGLAQTSLLQNPAARRNELQVAAELENFSKMQSFAISLFYPAYDKLIRELVRRAFTCTQRNPLAEKLVAKMKAACVRRGVDEDIFTKIDFEATTATRVAGAGSRHTRIMMFQQFSQFYAEMDEIGQEFFAYDFATEIGGIDRAQRYFGTPGVRRDHTDLSIVQLENAELKEGDFLDPVDGENKMLHLQGHLEAIEAGLDGVDKGEVDLGAFTLENVSLYKHLSDTLEQTTVHESRIGDLNAIRQRVQQVGEIMDNGFRHLNKLRKEGQPLPGEQQPGEQQPGGPEGEADGELMKEEALHQQKMRHAEEESAAKAHRIFQEGYQKVLLMREMGRAKLDQQRAEAMGKLAVLDAEMAAKLRNARILERAGGNK